MVKALLCTLTCIDRHSLVNLPFPRSQIKCVYFFHVYRQQALADAKGFSGGMELQEVKLEVDGDGSSARTSEELAVAKKEAILNSQDGAATMVSDQSNDLINCLYTRVIPYSDMVPECLPPKCHTCIVL